MNTHNAWAIKLYLADVILFANVVGNIFFIDMFLGGEFSTYGLQVASFVQEDSFNRTDPMTRVFPRMTKCIYKKFGPTGTIQTYDALCLLPINVINEKIYVFLWFWLVLLAVVTSVSVITHIAQATIPVILSGFIKRKARHREVCIRVVDDLSGKLWVGDWKLIYLLAYNMPPLVLGEFLTELGHQVSQREEFIKHCEDDANINARKRLLTPI